MTKSCENCRFAIHQDYGYSNYTTEGTIFICAKQLHPAGDFDRFYGKDKRLNFTGCFGYEEGEPNHLDVDGEEVLPDEIQALYGAGP